MHSVLTKCGHSSLQDGSVVFWASGACKLVSLTSCGEMWPYFLGCSVCTSLGGDARVPSPGSRGSIPVGSVLQTALPCDPASGRAFLCPLQLPRRVLNFLWVLCFLVLKFWFLFNYFYFSAKDVCLSIDFESTTFIAWSLVMMGASGSLMSLMPGSSQGRPLSIVFPLRIGHIFLALCMLSNYGLFPGHFE